MNKDNILNILNERENNHIYIKNSNNETIMIIPYDVAGISEEYYGLDSIILQSKADDLMIYTGMLAVEKIKKIERFRSTVTINI